MADWSNQDPPHPQKQPHQISSASSYADLQYMFGVQDPTMIAPKPNRNRRKPESSDHTKHRRTRSGCFMCRTRRIKCDEAQPICERCRKGKRECIYPEEKRTPKGGSSSKKTSSAVLENEYSSDEDDREASPENQQLMPIPDEDEVDNTSKFEDISISRTQNSGVYSHNETTRQSSEVPSLVHDKGGSPTPSTEGSVGYPTPHMFRSSRPMNVRAPPERRSNWYYLPPDLQFYLDYFYENVNHLHYSLKFDPTNFLKTAFLDIALKNEALLHAVVGFAAFQKTLHTRDGKIQDFLQYYNKSVSLLLKSLKRGERHDLATLLTILQLATIEEFLGDWVNLLGHQKAAYQMLTELYTPQSVMEEPVTRVVLGWYIRFDVFAGLIGGFEMVLSRNWFSYSHEFFQRQIATEPSNLNFKIELSITTLRLIAMDMSTVFIKFGKGESTREQFMKENDVVGRRLETWKSEMDPALQDSRYAVTDFTGARPRDPDDIVDPYQPGIIYRGPLWTINVSTIDWYSVDLMHKYQTALTLQQQPSAELEIKAYECCQLLEAVEFYPESPVGTIVALQASLGIACLFLPRDEKHAMWARRKLANIEAHGYIYPYAFRTKMADLFRDRSCMHWWLPNDENFSPIIRSIRKFVEERTSQATDMSGEDVRDMKAIFSSLNLDDSSTNMLPAVNKEKEPVREVALAPRSEFGDTSDPYGYDDGQNY